MLDKMQLIQWTSVKWIVLIVLIASVGETVRLTLVTNERINQEATKIAMAPEHTSGTTISNPSFEPALFPKGAVRLFGFQKPPDTQEDHFVMLPKTSLDVRLTGVFLSPYDDHSSALISVDGGKVSEVTIGDRIGDNVTVHSVTKNMVVLRVDGKLETVYFNRGQ